MKKQLAIALAFLIAGTAAFAETATIGSAGMKVSIPDHFEMYTLSDEEAEEGVFAHYGSESPQMEMYIFEYANDSWTIEELAAALGEEDGTQATGLTTINGIDAAYRVYDSGDITCVQYAIIKNGTINDIIFSVGSDESKQISMDIMNSLEE